MNVQYIIQIKAYLSSYRVKLELCGYDDCIHMMADNTK